VVPFFNHSELWYINGLAKSVGCRYPFPNVEVLVPDDGERSFSQYITQTLPSLRTIRPGTSGECLCNSCTVTMPTTQQQTTAPLPVLNNEANHESNNNNNNQVKLAEVEEPVAVLLIGMTLMSTTTMIKMFQLMLLLQLNRSRITMKPASTFYKLKFQIEKRLPTTCLLLIVIVERYTRSETTQMLHMRSIVLYVEGNIALRTALP